MRLKRANNHPNGIFLMAFDENGNEMYLEADSTTKRLKVDSSKLYVVFGIIY